MKGDLLNAELFVKALKSNEGEGGGLGGLKNEEAVLKRHNEALKGDGKVLNDDGMP